ncbi:anti-sigma B factor antagonist [candidate division KSB3 bacterium]|uniref:Anti-sigma factor antagonist n=1 Tax=candidate division KSB3 bacterium TaxID=2044937 RepID=A0A2G6E2L2_9BACT|nr:MAG: anti-sigma B factor antagonist [candidate division KSB3 bacterium]PIE28809.1 MAG: anti-sigma B factor antagonist [candidate division KSB3 bacterium]
MTCHISTDHHVSLIELAGDIDGKTAGEIQERIFPDVETASKILVNMHEVEYMSSAGLRMLLLLYRQVRKKSGQIALVGLSEDIKDIMSVTGFLEYFRVCDTIEEGLALLEEGP